MTAPEELRRIAEEERQKTSRPRHRIGVCTASGCLSCGSGDLLKSLQRELAARPEISTRVAGVGCMGLCSQGPLVMVQGQDQAATPDSDPSPDQPASRPTADSTDPTATNATSADRRLYLRLQPEDAPALLADLAANRQVGSPGERLPQTQPAGSQPAAAPALAAKLCDLNQPFFRRQHRVVLDQLENIEPERIESYLAADGYQALLDCVWHRQPAAIIDQITRSGLRGRGGGGYPTGLKWSTVAKAAIPAGGRKYVICNADEGDPGAFMDRSVLESAPHRVLEGMAIAACAVGADFGYLYVRAEYPLAVARLQKAISQAEKLGLLGSHVGGSAFHFKVEIRLGAGAFVCGEETALIASIEGGRGQPRPRPPYPAEYGIKGCPTLINNVETFANVPAIINRGAEWFAALGSDKSKGTKVFALAGKVRNTGLIEVPMGISLREIVEEMGGGAPAGAIKAVQTGGPSGGCIPAAHFHLPVDYESLQTEGSIMGSGGMIVMDEEAGMVDVARFFMEFCVDESCGKCVPCRVGTRQILLLLEKIKAGQADQADLDRLEELCAMVRQTSLCGLGQSAPNPVLSTLKFFRGEYQALLREQPGSSPRDQHRQPAKEQQP